MAELTAADVGASAPAGSLDADAPSTATTLSPVTNTFTVHGDLSVLAPAWVGALGELEEISRTRTANAGTYTYTYAELADVLSHSRPILAKHDLAVFQIPQIVNGDITVTTIVMHTSGAFLQFAPFELPAGNTVQQTGSATTYARRYSATSILGLATEDDDGKNAGTRTQKTTLSPANVTRFMEAATEALLTPDEIGAVVKEATNGRTDNPAEVFVSEVQALREALHAASADDQIRPAPAESGEGEVEGTLVDPSPDQLELDGE